jgi:hypothetical protein
MNRSRIREEADASNYANLEVEPSATQRKGLDKGKMN